MSDLLYELVNPIHGSFRAYDLSARAWDVTESLMALTIRFERTLCSFLGDHL